MLNFVLCDDDIRMLNRISSLLEKVIITNDFDAKIVFTTTDSKELLSYISTNKVNVVILDIEFNGHHENGLDIDVSTAGKLYDYLKKEWKKGTSL